MNIKPILIATAVALTSINANARCMLAGKILPYGYSFTAADVASSVIMNSVPTGQHATSYTCSLKNMFRPFATYDTQTVLVGDSYTPTDAGLCDPQDSTVRRLDCTVASSEYNTFNVSYNNGGGTGSAPSTPTNCTYNGTCNAPENTFNAPVDKAFQNWVCTKSNGTSCGTFLSGQSISTATTTNNDTITLTAQWLNLVPFKTPTSKSYVDAQLNGRQPQFANLGNNKLMLYGTTNGAVTSRDIVTSLGTSTTADSIPTRGAINTALATKQNKLNGTAGWVVANTGTAGVLGERPIYSTTNNYRQSLVEADDLNTIITDAVNSELVQVDETGEPNANGTLWKLNDVANLTLPTLQVAVASINGTSYCYRERAGNYNDDGTCSAATLTTLGATNSRSGMWGAVMPYGDIVGKSVCSNSISGTWGDVATDAQNDALDAAFSAQTNDTVYCWCKMDSVGGEPAVSRWVFAYLFEGSCASSCAAECGEDVSGNASFNSSFRTSMFGTVQ